MKKIFLFLSLVWFTSSTINAQFNVSFMTNADNSLVGVGYAFNEKLATDFRLYSTSAMSDATIQALLRYNFVRKEDYSVYVSGGLILNQINAATLPVGVEFKPFKNQQKFSIFVELQPFYEFDFSELFIAGFGGVRFSFN